MSLELRRKPGLTTMYVAALGVVYGDIGTSPLYTMRECFNAGGVELTQANVMGILSLIAWALILIVTIKYVAIVLKADNRGEGGTFALTTLALDQFSSKYVRTTIFTLGIIGACLFYGDALITPAISVLGAMEGLEVVSPHMHPYIIPLSVLIIFGLFAVQRHGTGKVGAFFGPIMLLWFGVLGVLGLSQIYLHPEIIYALNPMYAASFVMHNPTMAFLSLGSVVLAVTGSEAIYADMGHFGRQPIRLAWNTFVLPCLLLNYFGQGALLLFAPNAIENPFYYMVPEMFLIPMVVLAAMATVIASQAVISGAFSLTHQAVQLGYLPRMRIKHTSSTDIGQIYVPILNRGLMIMVIVLILSFKNSSNLAAAYGITVICTMLVTAILTTVVLIRRNKWPWPLVAVFALTFVGLDTTFLAANIHKIPDGGWLPIAIGLVIFFFMYTWVRGRELSKLTVYENAVPLDDFLHHFAPNAQRIKRTAVFLTSDLNFTPPALTYNYVHNEILHEQTIIIRINQARTPRYPESERIRVHHLKEGFTTIRATYGFMEQANVPALLRICEAHHGLKICHPDKLSYIVSHHTYVPSKKPLLHPLQEPLFILMDSLAQSAIKFFGIPKAQVFEIGKHIDI